MNEGALNAQWIWRSGEGRGKNLYLYVRRAFTIPGAIKAARIRLSADSRYKLFVNAVSVARGPARCDRRWQCVDQWDIAHVLRPGMNVVASLVHHYGEWTFSYMLGRPGFIAEIAVEMADGQVIKLGTDSSWRVQPARAWERNLPRMSIQLGYPEVYDARQETEGWKDLSFDDSGWEPAAIVGAAGMEPWPRLVPREIPPMTEVPLQPERVIDAGEVGNARTGHYVDLLRVIWSTSHAVAFLATFVWSPEDVGAEIHAGSQEALRLWVNGEPAISHLVCRDPAPDQEIVPVSLRSGWNTVLAKIVQGEGQWHFYFRFEGKTAETLAYSSTRETSPGAAGLLQPWKIIGPFESEGVAQGFERQYPPELELDFERVYRGKDGKEIRWISAGVTSESRITSVIMSREERFSQGSVALKEFDGLVASGAPALFYPGAAQGRYAVIDFGKEVTGYPTIEIGQALGGEVIDLGYGEVMQTREGEIISPASEHIGIVNPDRSGVHYADRYICRPGKQRFQTFDKRAFRYLQLDVRNVRSPIAVGPVSLVLSTYPVERRGSFTCSDSLLDRIWESGCWTVRLNMEDAYTDCPWRERGQWWGDVRIQALVNYYAFGDLALVRQGLRQIAQSQTSEGLTMGIYPTDWSNGILPTFTLLWIISLRDYYEFSGDRSIVAELFPSVKRALEYFEQFRSEHGLLRDVPYWLFVDWSEVEVAGESASVNALYYGALLAAAELADLGTGPPSGNEYRSRAEQIRRGMYERLWDQSRKCFRDAWKEGGTTQKISEQANCWAAVFGVSRPEDAGSMLEAAFHQNTGSVHIGTPYFGFYALQAMARAGLHERALDYMRNSWGRQLAWGATTWWELWEPKASFCHGWSSGPTQFLQAEILGVKPGKPGWEEILIEPHPGGLSWAKGRVPTPRGIITVHWRLEDGFILEVDTPVMGKVSVPRCKQGTVSVKKIGETVPAKLVRLPERVRAGTVVLPEPGSYSLHST